MDIYILLWYANICSTKNLYVYKIVYNCVLYTMAFKQIESY